MYAKYGRSHDFSLEFRTTSPIENIPLGNGKSNMVMSDIRRYRRHISPAATRAGGSLHWMTSEPL